MAQLTGSAFVVNAVFISGEFCLLGFHPCVHEDEAGHAASQNGLCLYQLCRDLPCLP